MKKLITLIVIVFFAIGEARSQDPEFTQFYANPLYLNPAFAGSSGGIRFALNFRNQWPSISGNYVTYAASYDQHFDAIGGGIGMQIWYDNAGDGNLSTTVGSGMYSYQLDVSREFTIKAGLQASIYQRSIDFSKLTWGDQIHPRLGFIYDTEEPIPTSGEYSADPFVDFSFGFLGFTDNFYGGIAVHHITEPTKSFYGNANSILPRKFTVNVGTMIPLEQSRNPEVFLSPNIMYQTQQDFTQVNFGAYYIHKAFVAGLWFRQTQPNSDAIMALVGVKHDIFRFGYSYDLTVSDARSAARGSHEVAVIIELDPPNRGQTQKWRGLNCPDF